MATAASQAGCELVSFPGNSELSVASVLTRIGPSAKLVDCPAKRAGNEGVGITVQLPARCRVQAAA